MATRPTLTKFGGKVVAGPLMKASGTKPPVGSVTKPTGGKPIPSGTRPVGIRPPINIPKPGGPKPIPSNVNRGQAPPGTQQMAQNALIKRMTAQRQSRALGKMASRRVKRYVNER